MIQDLLVIPESQGGPRFFTGQWVTTSLEIPGTHTTPDGRPIGVYRDREAILVPKQTGDNIMVKERVWMPPRVVFRSAKTGLDLLMAVEEGNEVKLVPVAIAADKLPDLQPLDEHDHLPEFIKRTSRFKPGTKLTRIRPEDIRDDIV